MLFVVNQNLKLKENHTKWRCRNGHVIPGLQQNAALILRRWSTLRYKFLRTPYLAGRVVWTLRTASLSTSVSMTRDANTKSSLVEPFMKKKGDECFLNALVCASEDLTAGIDQKGKLFYTLITEVCKAKEQAYNTQRNDKPINHCAGEVFLECLLFLCYVAKFHRAKTSEWNSDDDIHRTTAL